MKQGSEGRASLVLKLGDLWMEEDQEGRRGEVPFLEIEEVGQG